MKQEQAIVPLTTPTNNMNKKKWTLCSIMQVKLKSNKKLKNTFANFPLHIKAKTKRTFYTKRKPQLGQPHSTIAQGLSKYGEKEKHTQPSHKVYKIGKKIPEKQGQREGTSNYQQGGWSP